MYQPLNGQPLNSRPPISSSILDTAGRPYHRRHRSLNQSNLGTHKQPYTHARIQQWVGITRTAHDRFASYQSDRSFSAAIDDYVSSCALLSCGVPQGSVPGPILFSLHMLFSSLLCKRHKQIPYQTRIHQNAANAEHRTQLIVLGC